MGYGYQHYVGAPAFGARLNFVYQLTTTVSVEGLQCSECQAFGTADSHGVAGVELGALEVGDHEELQADGTTAQDEHCFARDDAGFLDGFHDGIDGLDESCFFEGDVIGKGHDAAFGDPGHGFYILAEAAAIGSETSGEPGGLVLLALGEQAAFAVKTFGAGDVMEAHHPVAEMPFV